MATGAEALSSGSRLMCDVLLKELEAIFADFLISG
jgi:hypothetical protein